MTDVDDPAFDNFYQRNFAAPVPRRRARLTRRPLSHPGSSVASMCGRFVSTANPERIASYFGAEADVETLGENFNVAPTQDIYGVVTGPDGVLRVQAFHWGLIPSWAKDRKIGAEDDQRPVGDAGREAGVQGPVRQEAVPDPDGRVLRVEGRGRRRAASTPRASHSSSRCSSTASTANRWPSPGCGRRGRTPKPGAAGCRAQPSSPRRPTRRCRPCTTACRSSCRRHGGRSGSTPTTTTSPRCRAVHRAQRRHPHDASGVDRGQQRPQQRRPIA